MFKDTEKELKRLEAELLAEEEMDEQQEAYAPDGEFSDTWADDTQIFECVPQYRDAVNGYEAADHIYNSDDLDEDLDAFSQEVREPRKNSITGLLITALLLTAGILAVVAWWLIRYWEVFG